jgi:CDP-6-deoxy-D-xylo-4-hexulose-3-dehydrase
MRTMRTEKEIRDDIFSRVVELYNLRESQKRFIPGQDRLNYAGRVYDEKEMISLVDASLDFWLTSGRYARRFEADLARFIGVDHCLLTNSGSSANLIASSAREDLCPEMKLSPPPVVFPPHSIL